MLREDSILAIYGRAGSIVGQHGVSSFEGTFSSHQAFLFFDFVMKVIRLAGTESGRFKKGFS